MVNECWLVLFASEHCVHGKKLTLPFETLKHHAPRNPFARWANVSTSLIQRIVWEIQRGFAANSCSSTSVYDALNDSIAVLRPTGWDLHIAGELCLGASFGDCNHNELQHVTTTTWYGKHTTWCMENCQTFYHYKWFVAFFMRPECHWSSSCVNHLLQDVFFIINVEHDHS